MAVKATSRPKDLFTKMSPRMGLAGTGACYLMNTEGALVFRLAAPSSSAEEAVKCGLLKEGDVLMKIDGEDTQGRSIPELASKLLGAPSTNVQLTFKRGDKSVDLSLQRRLH
eukprot:CAMPEP_0113674510 /NCGR_PEP_ID=MMETSP0038_2-20120614/7456_1 /TAXON_ID=2898 /ORGANISM="Cryptomonas paramecium" /LENGTH=111 /DNA_ID=CAMNT_0000591093 /DNA_START=36 /DNA_END=371 /DNA_ORIENTATION=- /assembly_acc=CAM_ASM_000170